MTSRSFDVREGEDGEFSYEIAVDGEVVERFVCWDEDRFHDVAEIRAQDALKGFFWEVVE